MSKFTVIVKLVVCFVELGIFSIVSHGIVEAAVALMYINGSYKPVRERGAEKKKRRRGEGEEIQRSAREQREGKEKSPLKLSLVAEKGCQEITFAGIALLYTFSSYPCRSSCRLNLKCVVQVWVHMQDGAKI